MEHNIFLKFCNTIKNYFTGHNHYVKSKKKNHNHYVKRKKKIPHGFE